MGERLRNPRILGQGGGGGVRDGGDSSRDGEERRWLTPSWGVLRMAEILVQCRDRVPYFGRKLRNTYKNTSWCL